MMPPIVRGLNYFTLDEHFCHRRRVGIQSDVGPISCTQLLTSVIGIPISSYHFGTSSSYRFRGLPLGRFHTGWITSALLWGAVGAILMTCDHHLILFLFAVCSAGCMFTRRLISSFRIFSILFFPAAFLRQLVSVVVNICLSLLVSVPFSLWYSSVGVSLLMDCQTIPFANIEALAQRRTAWNTMVNRLPQTNNNINLPLLPLGPVGLIWMSYIHWGEYRLYDLCLGRHGDFFVPKYR